MSNTINSLREALKFSPNNIPLKLHLAETLLEQYMLDEAATEFQELLELEDNQTAQEGLAKVFFLQKQFSKCNVIIEGLLESGDVSFDTLIIYSKALLKENEIEQALEVYKTAIDRNPSYQDKELDAALRVSIKHDDEATGDTSIIVKPDVSFKDVGGMNDVKKEIDLKIIQPMIYPEIYKAYGKKIGGGILLYGPPGCGKTHIAKATAGEINAKFISVGLNDVLDMWIGNSEKNLNEIFELARQNKPCVLFFDEIDALGASRSDMKQSAGRHLINQFLQELDGIDGDNEGVLVLGATNTPWNLDQAFRRPGRFDRIIFVPPPDINAREEILKIKMRDKLSENVNYNEVAQKTKEYSGADIEAVIDISIEDKLEDAIKTGKPQPLNTKDLIKAVKKHKPTTAEWFATARNFALYANESGIYDTILTYLKIKK